MIRSERGAILDDVEGQVVDMLASRASATPTLADVEAILAELDPPTAYADSLRVGGGSSAAGTENPHRLSAAAVAALIVGLIGVVSFFTYIPEIDGLLEMATPFLTTALGVIAIIQIRRSQGRLYGMWLAVASALLFPLFILDGGTIFFADSTYSIVRTPEEATLADEEGGLTYEMFELLVVCATVVVLVPVNIAIFQFVRRGVSPRHRWAESFLRGAGSSMLSLAGLILLEAGCFFADGPHARGIETGAAIVFLGFQVAAVAAGIFWWRTLFGKAGILTGTLMLGLSLLFVV